MDDILAVKEQVRIYTVLRDYDVDFIGGGMPEQIHCPFHGADLNRSARVYPDNDSVYCFVCDKTWDVIEFVKDKEEFTFGKAVAWCKSRYGVEVWTPDYETRLLQYKKRPQEDLEAFSATVERMFIAAAERLTSGQLWPILTTYNKCLAELEDLRLTHNFTVRNLKYWYEYSERLLRTELQHGQEINQTP